MAMEVTPAGSAGAKTNGAAPTQGPAEDANAAFSETFAATNANAGANVDLDAIFEAAGRKYGLPPNLLKAVAKAESGFRADATSRVGAMGIMQLMPGTAKHLGVTNAYDPEQNIMGGAKYLREMLDKHGGDLRLALAAYNAGPGAIARNGGEPLESQLKGYIPKVLGYYNGGEIRAGMSVGGAGQYNGGNLGKASDASGAPGYSEALRQMMLFKVIEMQMKPPDEDKDGLYY